MNFEEALAAARGGAAIHRPVWSERAYLFVDLEGQLTRRTRWRHRSPWLNTDDLLASDWQLVTDTLTFFDAPAQA